MNEMARSDSGALSYADHVNESSCPMPAWTCSITSDAATLKPVLKRFLQRRSDADTHATLSDKERDLNRLHSAIEPIIQERHLPLFWSIVFHLTGQRESVSSEIFRRESLLLARGVDL